MKTVLLIFLLLVTVGIIYAAATFSYKCPKCGLIQEYSIPGIYKCPKDGTYMIPAN